LSIHFWAADFLNVHIDVLTGHLPKLLLDLINLCTLLADDNTRTGGENRNTATIGSALNAELDSYARSVMEHAAKAVELDLAWIDDILAQEKNVGNSSAHNIATEAK